MQTREKKLCRAQIENVHTLCALHYVMHNVITLCNAHIITLLIM